MSRYIAFLRAINVGSVRTIRMKSLRQIFALLGFSNVTTFIVSGNVIFETRAKNSIALEKRLEKRLQEELRYEVATFIRKDTRLIKIAHYKPFPGSKIKATSEVNIIFLSDAPSRKLRQKVMELQTETNEFHAIRENRIAFDQTCFYPGGEESHRMKE